MKCKDETHTKKDKNQTGKRARLPTILIDASFESAVNECVLGKRSY
jgi:hypothetical protein